MAKQYRYTVYYDAESKKWQLEDWMENGIYDTDADEFLPLEEIELEIYQQNENLLAELIGRN